MRIRIWQLALVVVATIFGGIAIASILGFWQTEGGLGNGNGNGSGRNIEAAGAVIPDDIRGSTSFTAISALFDIPLSDLGTAFGVPQGDLSAFLCKDLEELYPDLAEQGIDVGTGSVRTFVSLYTGLPLDSEEESCLPIPAAEILKQKADLTAEQLEWLDQITVELP